MFLLKIIKNSRMEGMLGLGVLTLALFLKSFIQGADPEASSAIVAHKGMPLYNMIFGAIHTAPFLNRLVAIALFLLIGYILIRIAVRYMLLHFRSLMPALFFILFSAVLPGTQQVSPALVGSVFFLLCFSVLYDVHDKPADTFMVFTASLFLVLGSMFYLKLIWFFPLLLASLWTIRTVTWREMLYPVFAFMLMALFLITWYWGIKDDLTALSTLLRDNLAFTGSFKAYHFSAYIYYGFFVGLIGVASFHMAKRFQTSKTMTQNIYQALFYMFLAGIVFFVVITRFDPTTLVFIAMPLSYILTNFFHRKDQHWSHELALWVLLGLLVFVQLSV
jgi:hypothetical protein